MSVRIGINPITWSNDDMPALGGDTPLEVCLAETKQAGYAGIEMGGKFPKTTAELRPVLARHGLDFISGWYSAKLLERDAKAEIASIAAHLDLMAGMGCKVMVFAEGSGATHGDRTQPAGKRRTIADGEWAEYGRRVTAVADHMAERGVRLAFHHHMGTAIQTADEIDRLMGATGGSVGLLLDTGHTTYAGGDPLALARKHARRIVHVHCKDVRRPVLDQALKKNQSFLDAVVDGVFTVPGDGSIDFKPVLSHLAGQGYQGWLVVEAEQDPAKAHPLTYATMGCRNLSKLARDAGFALVA
ncbi:MAG: myo-inosose-2 dehydratase [Alphaproteobacteria bacterium]|nr:myo-inosose-2 dehydratase [Alphaproteobacteria bacterium]